YEPSLDAPVEVRAAMFPISAYSTTVEWLYSLVPVRFPKLKIALSESGLGFLTMLFDRLDYNIRRWDESGLFTGWKADVDPLDVLRRNFWFTILYDPMALEHRETIGLDRIMFET